MRSALGKGLNALISEETVASVSAAPAVPSVSMLAIEKIQANTLQPRRRFSEEALNDLAASIRHKGVLQPILVAPVDGGNYQIVAGERRWRAAQRAGLKEVPVVIRQGSESERFEMALIENVQREDLNPIELAEGYRRLQDEFKMTQDAIAQVIGKDRSVIANTLRFLSLCEEIQQALREGKITAGHAKALLAIEDETARKALFDQIISGALTVRHAEAAAKAHNKGEKPEHLRAAGYDEKAPEIKSLEEELQRHLTRKVEIHSSPKHKGWVKLEFYSLDDFDHLMTQLKKPA